MPYAARGMMYMDSSYLLILLGLGLGLAAQWLVRHNYSKYSAVMTRRGEDASDLVLDMLRRNGNDAVTLRRLSGELTDHYNPADDTLGLSQGVYGSASVSAVAIAAHEAGHAMQKMDGYAPLKLRSLSVPAVNIGSQAAMPLFLLGLVMSFRPLLYVGIGLFGLTVLFALITLPVEFDASRRALRMLEEGGYLEQDELNGARKVLTAAAMTYVASALSAVLNLVRLLMIAGVIGGRRRRD